jgi:hypothetical protein
MITKPNITELYPALIKGIHPDADLIPAPTDEEFNDLCNSVKEHGIQNPIHINSAGLLLDGRTRLEAASVTGTADIPIITVDPADTTAFILSQNLHRRHLTSVQRGAIIARISTNKWGGDRRPDQVSDQKLDRPLTDKEWGRISNVSPITISKNKYVLSWAPKEAKQVEAGTMSLNAAYCIAQRNEEMAKDRLLEKSLPPEPKEIPSLKDFMRRFSFQLAMEFGDNSPKIKKLEELAKIREDMPESLWYELGSLVVALKGAAVKLASYAQRLERPSGKVQEEPKQAVKSLPNNTE